jgi:DNA-binding GntR family transcriptional regulator
LAGQVRDHIVFEIAQGRMSPGMRLRELDIARQLGTSQTPVREAFRELAALGLVESRVHLGTRVRDVAERDLVEAVPVRAALEGVAGRLAVPLLGGEAADARAWLASMREVAKTGDRLGYSSACTQFHRSIILSARNESLARAWNALGIEVMTIMTMASSTMSLGDAADTHEEIVDALESGDPQRAEQALATHVAQYLPGTRRPDEAAINDRSA